MDSFYHNNTGYYSGRHGGYEEPAYVSQDYRFVDRSSGGAELVVRVRDYKGKVYMNLTRGHLFQPLSEKEFEDLIDPQVCNIFRKEFKKANRALTAKLAQDPSVGIKNETTIPTSNRSKELERRKQLQQKVIENQLRIQEAQFAADPYTSSDTESADEEVVTVPLKTDLKKQLASSGAESTSSAVKSKKADIKP